MIILLIQKNNSFVSPLNIIWIFSSTSDLKLLIISTVVEVSTDVFVNLENVEIYRFIIFLKISNYNQKFNQLGNIYWIYFLVLWHLLIESVFSVTLHRFVKSLKLVLQDYSKLSQFKVGSLTVICIQFYFE